MAVVRHGAAWLAGGSAASVAGGHLLHAIVLGIPIPIVLAVIVREELRKRRTRNAPPAPLYRHAILAVAVLGSLGAASIHATVISEHFREYPPAGVFFVVTCAAQAAWAAAVVWRPTQPLLVAGLLGNGGVAALWLVSRTVGVPFGENGGGREVVGVADAVCTVVEVLVVFAVLAALRRGPTQQTALRQPA